MNDVVARKIDEARQVVSAKLDGVGRDAVLASLPAPTEAQLHALEASPTLKEAIMRQFGDAELFFAWLKKGEVQ